MFLGLVTAPRLTPEPLLREGVDGYRVDHVVWEVLVQIGEGVRVLGREERGGKGREERGTEGRGEREGEKGKEREKKEGGVRGESELYVNHTHTHVHTHLRESLVLSPQPVPCRQLPEALQVHPVQSTNVILAVTKEILPVASVPKSAI